MRLWGVEGVRDDASIENFGIFRVDLIFFLNQYVIDINIYYIRFGIIFLD